MGGVWYGFFTWEVLGVISARTSAMTDVPWVSGVIRVLGIELMFSHLDTGGATISGRQSLGGGLPVIGIFSARRHVVSTDSA